jgi:glycosyltransferase involved in cell wall biosynthesis
LRIVVIGPVPPFRGGISHHNSKLINSLTKLDNDILSISFSRQYPKFLYPGENDKDLTQAIIINSEPIIDMLNPISWIKSYQRIKQFNPEKIIFHWWTTYFSLYYFFICLLLKNHPYKKICIIHNLFPHERKWFDKFFTRIALFNFDELFFHSSNEENRFKELFPKKKCHLFPHPLYDNYLEKRIEKNDAKKILNISEENLLILMFGIIRPYKGLTYLLLAMKELVKKNDKYKLIVAGEFWEPIDKYNNMIVELGLKNYVIIHNKYIPDNKVPIYFSAADIFVAPYIAGTQSGALKIALSYELPIVATSIISEEKVDGDINWIAVPPKDSESLTSAIQKIQIKNESKNKKYASWTEFASLIIGN